MDSANGFTFQSISDIRDNGNYACIYIITEVDTRRKRDKRANTFENEVKINIISAHLFWYIKKCTNCEISKCEPGSDGWMGSSCLYLGC